MHKLLPFLLCSCVLTPEPKLSIIVRSDTTIPAGEQRLFDIESTSTSMPFRISLFAGDLVSGDGDTLHFVDDDGDGVADRGTPMEWAFLDSYSDDLDTLPKTDDNPADPSGLYYRADSGWKHLRPEVTGVQAGTVWLVVHENGGLSTHLEIDDSGEALELVAALNLTIVE